LFGKKKTREEDLAGLLTMSDFILAGTVAIRTHAPLVRHGFYGFYRTE
jgi:hypothetical protein